MLLDHHKGFILLGESMTRVDTLKAQKEQILRLFVPDEKLLAAQVSMRLEQRTAGRGKLSDSAVISRLKALVAEGNLVEEVKPLVVASHTLNRTEYSLPSL
jgi:hypothetical protein